MANGTLFVVWLDLPATGHPPRLASINSMCPVTPTGRASLCEVRLHVGRYRAPSVRHGQVGVVIGNIRCTCSGRETTNTNTKLAQSSRPCSGTHRSGQHSHITRALCSLSIDSKLLLLLLHVLLFFSFLVQSVYDYRD